LGAPSHRLYATEDGTLTFQNQRTQLLRTGLTNELEGILEPKLGNNIDIPRVLLIKQGMNTMQHHVEFRPVIAISFTDPSVEIEHFPANTDPQ
jgi:hypothetical protein